MKAFDMILAALALRASPAKPQQAPVRLVPAIDDADNAMLDRAALPQQRAALIASLWPPARQCVVPPVFSELPAPAIFGASFRISFLTKPQQDARALQARLHAAFPLAEGKPQVQRKSDAA
jgi:hypothetical protein